MPYPFSFPTVTIAAGTSLSPAVFLSAGELVAIETPASWTAANITFQASVDGANFFDLHDDAGNEVTVTAAASQHIAVGEGSGAKAEHFRGAPYLTVRSGTSGSPVNQAAGRVITLVVRKIPIPRF